MSKSFGWARIRNHTETDNLGHYVVIRLNWFFSLVDWTGTVQINYLVTSALSLVVTKSSLKLFDVLGCTIFSFQCTAVESLSPKPCLSNSNRTR